MPRLTDEQYAKRRQTMLKKYGGEAGLKKHYREMQKKSAEKGLQKAENKRGFSYATSEEQSENSKKRWKKSKTE